MAVEEHLDTKARQTGRTGSDAWWRGDVHIYEVGRASAVEAVNPVRHVCAHTGRISDAATAPTWSRRDAPGSTFSSNTTLACILPSLSLLKSSISLGQRRVPTLDANLTPSSRRSTNLRMRLLALSGMSPLKTITDDEGDMAPRGKEEE